MKTVVMILMLLVPAISSSAEVQLSVGSTYRLHAQTITPGRVVELGWVSEPWKLSLGVVTTQRWFEQGLDRLLVVTNYPYVTGQFIHIFRTNRLVQPFLAFGVSIHPQKKPLLGTVGSWASSLGLRIGGLRLEFRHNSNANITLPNWGQDVWTVGWAWQF